MGKRDDLGPSRLDRAGRALADGGHISGGLGEGSDMSKLKNAGTMLITAIPIVVWLWGVASYGVAGDTLGSIAAFVVPPVGVLHALGAL